MTKLEAIKALFPGAKIVESPFYSVEAFEVDDRVYTVYTGDELEHEAKVMYECILREDISGLTEWVNKWGYENFYNEEYINDFRIEDSEMFGDMSDEEIIEEIRDMGYLDNITENMVDFDKCVEYCYDADGVQICSRYDGKFIESGEYTVIRED